MSQPTPPPANVRTRAEQEYDRTVLRQAMFAKWDGEKFVHGHDAAKLRGVLTPTFRIHGTHYDTEAE